MVSKPTGRPRGRPQLRFRDDPERYFIARFVAECRFKAPRMSDRGIAVAMTMVRNGELVAEPDNVKKFLSASGPALFRYTRQVRGAAGRAGEHRRNTSAFHPPAEDLAHKARRLLGPTKDPQDAVCLANMAAAWAFALKGPSLEVAFNKASLHCWKIGETRFFETVLRPIIKHRFGLGPVPYFSAPDFIPYDAA